MIGRAHWGCEEYCYGCKFRISNLGISNCHDYRHHTKVIITQTIPLINSGKLTGNFNSANSKYIYVGCSVLTAALLIVLTAIAYYKNKNRIKDSGNAVKNLKMSDLGDKLISYKDKVLEFAGQNGGIRFVKWKNEKENWGKRIQDLVQNIMLLVNGTMAIVFAEKWSGDNNPLLIINNKFRTSFSFTDNTSDVQRILETDRVDQFVDVLNFWIYLVNMLNAVVAFLIILLWFFTKTGDRATWIKLRLINACSMLGSIFLALGIYFCNLTTLNGNIYYSLIQYHLIVLKVYNFFQLPSYLPPILKIL